MFLLFVPVTFGQSIEDQVKKFKDSRQYSVSYDKFEKETLVEYRGQLQTPGKGFIDSTFRDFSIYVYISDGKGEQRYYFFFSGGRGLIYNHDRLRLLLDNQLLDIEDETDISKNAAFAIKPSEWQKIADAATVEMQLRGFECKWDEKVMLAIKNLNSLTKSQ